MYLRPSYFCKANIVSSFRFLGFQMNKSFISFFLFWFKGFRFKWKSTRARPPGILKLFFYYRTFTFTRGNLPVVNFFVDDCDNLVVTRLLLIVTRQHLETFLTSDVFYAELIESMYKIAETSTQKEKDGKSLH